jgi:ABC-type multidrug transport system ATPase subunit
MQSERFCVETHGLTYRYTRDETMLRDIELRVPDGGIYGFLGPNGAGKTTTLRLLLGLLRIQEGSVSIFGQPLAPNRIEILRRIGSLIESPSLYDHLTARENLTVLQKIHRCPGGRIDEVLELVGLAATGRKRAGQFSLGMKQRLSLAMALLHSPSLLILDEPTNGLDPNGIIEMRELLIRLNREQGVTILVSSHLLPEIEKLVTHLGIIDRGRMLFQGTIGALRDRQKQLMKIAIRTSSNAAALGLLESEYPIARLEAGRIEIPAVTDEDIARLNRDQVTRGIDVYEIRAISDDLESIFMGLLEERAS